MSDLDATIARLRALPKADQDALAAQIDLLIEQRGNDALTPEQWAEIEARLDSGEGFTPHADVVRAFQDRFG